MQPIISVQNLSKRYKLGVFNAKTLREEAEAFLARFGRRKAELAVGSSQSSGNSSLATSHSSHAEPSSDFWALRDVSFDVQPGEVIGVIGRNGAGKSTLLKILSRITEPTSGEARIRGRVASLLEVGTGFHPELSGRENIFLNGAILGMTKQEIRNKFDEIVAFAEIEKFIDTPVKRYSSGMYVRLAFAVAAHLEPEILVVDEVLAVGDVNFQRKCLGKMKSVATQEGRTVLFVSHNSSALRALCTRGIVLQGGELVCEGEINQVVSDYEKDNLSDPGASAVLPYEVFPGLKLIECQFQPSTVSSDSSIQFRVSFEAAKQVQIRGLCLLFYSAAGVRVGVADLRRPEGGYSINPAMPLSLSGRIAKLNLVEATYFVGIHISAADFNGDMLNLASIDVVPRQEPRSVAPYPAHYRGFAEFDYEIHVNLPRGSC
jgi:ABC-type polysaccharide/polyol phosphate transport system ATPase subunit